MKIFLSLILFGLVSTASAEPKQVYVFGTIDMSTLVEITKTISEVQKNKNEKLIITITSPGGEAISGFTIARKLRTLSNTGVIVEIHAVGLCASACTWIIASGTPGHRFVDKDTFVVVHPIQRFNNGGDTCVRWIKEPKDVDDRISNQYLEIARELYMEFTGATKEVAEAWLTCGREQVGRGALLIRLNMADKLDD